MSAERFVPLNYDELVAACKNIDFDLTCGACACVFFTGHNIYDHDASCKTPPERRSKPVVITVSR